MNDAILAAKRLYQGWLNVVMVRLRIAGREVSWPLIEHPSGATVLAYDPRRGVALTVRQTRLAVLYAGAAPFPEAIGGVDDGDGPAAVATREAMEEAGVRLHTLEQVARIWVTPSTTTERVTLFLAEYGLDDRVSAGGGLEEEHERIDAREELLADLWAPIARGEMVDAKLLMVLQALRIRRPELFDRARFTG